MKALIFKEVKIGINIFFYILPLVLGALVLIPGWLYLIVLMYFAFITVPTVFATFRTNNDLFFSVMMPVTRKNIVKARITSIILIELLHVFGALVFAIIHYQVYSNNYYFFLEPDAIYFGLGFMMLALYNFVFIPMYYKTGDKYGLPAIVATALIILFCVVVEYSAIKVPFMKDLLHSQDSFVRGGILTVGIILFALSGIITYIISVKRFEKVDI